MHISYAKTVMLKKKAQAPIKKRPETGRFFGE